MKHATALRAFSHAGDEFAAGSTHSIAAGHFGDWEAVGLVREATAAEVAKVKGGSTGQTAPKRGRKPKTVAAPAVASETATVVVDADPNPAAPAA